MRHADPVDWGAQLGRPQASLEACDESDGSDVAAETSDPARLLATFARRMAGQGHYVNPRRMQNDRAYAMWQLARARTTGDPRLCRQASQLFDWLLQA